MDCRKSQDRALPAVEPKMNATFKPVSDGTCLSGIIEGRGKTPCAVKGKTMLILLMAVAVVVSFAIELAIEAIRDGWDEQES